MVPATGRARAGPWTESVLNTHPVLQRGNPGVYINGCCAFTEDGEALASTYLPPQPYDWADYRPVEGTPPTRWKVQL